MRWLPSTRTRYLILGLSFLALIELIDALARAMASYPGLGLAVTLWACFAVVYSWLLLEPIIDAAMVLRKVQDQPVLDRVQRIADKVAANGQMPAAKFCV